MLSWCQIEWNGAMLNALKDGHDNHHILFQDIGKYKLQMTLKWDELTDRRKSTYEMKISP
jgi:hypothetical protein